MNKNKIISISIGTISSLIGLVANALIFWAIAVSFMNYGICFRTILAFTLWYTLTQTKWSRVIKLVKDLENKLDEIDGKRRFVKEPDREF